MSGTIVNISSRQTPWRDVEHSIVVGKDILELLSSSMYVDPMTIYREYVQNAADAIEAAQASGLLMGPGKVEITIDLGFRTIKIRDNGSGIPADRFLSRMLAFGASEKRGSSARGFRGVGRLAGLGYCQELIFRTRTAADRTVQELRWDCRKLKTLLRAIDPGTDLFTAVHHVIQHRPAVNQTAPTHFFEVELRGLIRHRNDHLLNSAAVTDYLSQVAPVPFDAEFPYRDEVANHVKDHVKLGDVEIRVNDSAPIRRPHRRGVQRPSGEIDPYTGVQLVTISDAEGGIAALGWIAHHGYIGALSGCATTVRGLRFRCGNMQVGDDRLSEQIYAESRFNAWSVGEIHVVNPRILPNGRRDHFEQSVHFDDLLNGLSSIAKDVSHRCRISSIHRKWVRDFEFAEQYVEDRIAILRQGAIQKKAQEKLVGEIRTKLDVMAKTREREAQVAVLGSRVTQAIRRFERALARLSKENRTAPPLRRITDQTRRDYQRIFTLIYECSQNKANAMFLIDKILKELKTPLQDEPQTTR